MQKRPDPDRTVSSEEVFYLQRDFETDLLSIVTENAPRSAEEDETDPGLHLKDLFLYRHRESW